MPTWTWVAFSLFVVVMLVVDGLAHRQSRVMRPREAVAWTVLWVALALAFDGILWWRLGEVKALEFLTGYVIEQALSVDNLFVFMVLLTYFAVPKEQQHRVLSWGVIGAQVTRALFIGLGTAVLHRFHWVIYVFGVFLLATGVKLALPGDDEVHPERNPALRLLRRFMPITQGYHGRNFFVRREELVGTQPSSPHRARWLATPLFLVLVVIETTDVVFAIDSIPAIFGVSTDPFVVYTSNILAVLGLRSMYFVLAGALGRFHLLNYGLSAVLCFIGAKMLAAGVFPISVGVSLSVVAALLVSAIVASLVFPPKTTDEEPIVESPQPPGPNQ
jgi:tellurite resistance protein TerC